MNRRADNTADFVDGFFRRHPKLSKYRSHLRFREREQGGSAGHGEARQHGNEVWLFPKFWQHSREVQDFVLAHEVGHWVKSEFGGRGFIALAESKGIDPWDSPNLPFGQFNMDEAFADAFASYYTDGDVKHKYPAWAQLVEAVEAQDTVQKKQARAVAARYHLQQEVRRICASRLRVASREGERVRRELTPEVMLAFVEASGVRVASMKVAFDMIKKVKALWDAFTSVHGAWDRFKRVVGVHADTMLGALKELPHKIADLGKKGKELLHKLGAWLVEHVPFFRIYSEAHAKMPTLNTTLLKMVDYLPSRIASALKAAGKSARDFATMVDEYVEKHPVSAIAGTAASAALFTAIWLNVTEISWDVGDIVKGFLGMYSFAELLVSLPEAGVGLVLTLMFPGLPSRYLLNALLPVSVTLRILWLVGKEYASWEHGSLVIHWEKMGMEPPSDPLLLATLN